ncbi:c-type cytochrome [Niveispirillum sp. KHB5.9]|uniref:c-type cytochrome n=1 Tax=Niveispirillum sp. KHB5.9 TaxID=3400269 RepID=UPI003A8774BB
MLARRRPLHHGMVLTVLGALLAGLLVALAGIYNVAASSRHFAFTDRLLKLVLNRSIATYSLGIEPLPMDRPGMVELGARHFAAGCQPCHAGPGKAQNPIAAGMYPAAPALGDNVGHWNDAELFWIVRHGLKFTGMPQWPGDGRDDEIWPVVAFMRQLPDMPAARYKALTGTEGSGFSFEGGAATLALCANCHGDARRPPVSDLAPPLQGQNRDYLVRAMAEYAADQRQSGMMEPVAVALSPETIRELAGTYAAMSPIAAPSPDRGNEATGEVIARRGLREQNVGACLSCHDGGRSMQFPRLDGMSQPYMAQQLRLFRDGVRGGTPHAEMMRSVAARLTDRQIDDVTAWLAGRSTSGPQGAP